MKQMLGVMILAILSVGCDPPPTQDFNRDNDSLDGGADVVVGCTAGEYQCNDDMVQKCVLNAWVDWNDCSTDGRKCSVVEGQIRCVTVGENGIDGGSQDTETGTDDNDDPILESLQVSPPILTLARSTSGKLQVTGSYSNGTTADLTNSAAWSVANPVTASVSTGIVTALSPGETTVTASFQGKEASATITVTSATVEQIVIEPPAAVTMVDGIVRFTATAIVTGGTTQDITETALWVTENSSIATISSDGMATGVSPGETMVHASMAGQIGTATLTVTSAELLSINVTPTNPTVGEGVSLSFTAMGTFDDGTIADVTYSATWESSDTNILQIDEQGAAQAMIAGVAIVSASIGLISATSTVTVTGALLESITLAPASLILPVGGYEQLRATGTYDDNTVVDLTASVTWSSDNDTVAFVSIAPGTAGQVTGIGAGTTQIIASMDGQSAEADVTVTSAALDNIAISPVDPTIPRDNDLQFEAIGEYADGNSSNVTDRVTWDSLIPSVAVISNASRTKGMASAVGAGTSTITAGLDGIDAATTLTVTDAALVSIAVLPNNLIMDLGADHQFLAMGTFDDGSTIDLTVSVIWTASNEDVVSISNAPDSKGLLTALSDGTATVTATLGDKSGTAAVSVIEPELIGLNITPNMPVVPVGDFVEFYAIAVYSNNTTQVLWDDAEWTSSNTGVANFAEGKGGGRVEALSPGETTIEVTHNGFSASTVMTVTNARVIGISITPVGTTLAVGGSMNFQAVALYDNNTSQNVTGEVDWVSLAPSILALNSAKGAEFIGIAPGTATITATHEGIVGSVTVVVEALVIAEVQVWPVMAEAAVGVPIQFNAVVLYSNFSTETVTNEATWISSDSDVAAIENTGKSGTVGLATGISAGDTTISATYEGVTGSTTLTITGVALDRIQVTPFTPTLPVGFNIPLQATGIYVDNSLQDLTGLVTWSTSDPTIVSVSNGYGSNGLISPLAPGTVTISAAYAGETGTNQVEVTSSTLDTIDIEPAVSTIAVGDTMQYSARGNLSDATTLDITNHVTWLSSDHTIADVSNVQNIKGEAKGLSAGGVTITCVWDTVEGTALLSVE